MLALIPTLFLLPLLKNVYAGSLNRGDACTVSENRLQIGTFQYWDECNSVSFCSEKDGVCVAKRCRRDDFPFGYTPGMEFPEKCPKGQFCPDEGSDCQAVFAVGSQCQFNRDDQCEGPPNASELADTTGFGLNVNGSVCLNNICYYANETLGNDCVVQNTAYTAYGLEQEFINIVSRDNCRVGFYCDSPTKKCMKTKEVNEACTGDKECISFNCLTSGVCGKPAASARVFGAWVYVLVVIGILAAMGGILTTLYMGHKKQRDIEREKRMQYWREQNTFHQNLMQMRDAARASILSLPNQNGGSPRGSVYGQPYSDESMASILPNAAGAPKSGLRNYMGDNSFGSDDMLQPAKRAEGRF